MGRPPVLSSSVNQSAVFHLFQMFQVGYLERADGVDGHREGEVGTVWRILLAQTRAHCAQDAEDLRTIKTLTFAVLTDAHDDLSPFTVATDASEGGDVHQTARLGRE